MYVCVMCAFVLVCVCCGWVCVVCCGWVCPTPCVHTMLLGSDHSFSRGGCVVYVHMTIGFRPFLQQGRVCGLRSYDYWVQTIPSAGEGVWFTFI